MADVKKLADELMGLTILEAKELNDILEENGIKAAAAVAVAGPAAAGAAAESRSERADRKLGDVVDRTPGALIGGVGADEVQAGGGAGRRGERFEIVRRVRASLADDPVGPRGQLDDPRPPQRAEELGRLATGLGLAVGALVAAGDDLDETAVAAAATADGDLRLEQVEDHPVGDGEARGERLWILLLELLEGLLVPVHIAPLGRLAADDQLNDLHQCWLRQYIEQP